MTQAHLAVLLALAAFPAHAQEAHGAPEPDAAPARPVPTVGEREFELLPLGEAAQELLVAGGLDALVRRRLSS